MDSEARLRALIRNDLAVLDVADGFSMSACGLRGTRDRSGLPGGQAES